jgi:hypothetical protein
MKNIPWSLFQLSVLLILLFQTSLCGTAQKLESPTSSSDLQFVSGQSARRIPFEFVGNHIYLRARVNNSAPLWFFLDSGATSSYFDVQQAKALGLEIQAGSVKVSLNLPGVTLSNQTIPIRTLGFSEYDGHAIEGMLGYNFISRFVMEIDYARKTISLYEPKSYRYSGSGDSIPLIMLEDDSGGKVPLVRAIVAEHGRDAIEGKFIADTGVRVDLSYNIPFAEKNRMLQSTEKTIQVFFGGGAMVKEGKWLLGRVQSLLLGRFEIDNPMAALPQDTNTKGVLASPEFDGVIGAEILRRFKVIFDYSRERMILEPNKRFSESYEYDMSGMLLVVEGSDSKTIKVRRVIDNSPAMEIGVHEGDVILNINGKAAAKLTLEQVRQMFKREGLSYVLSIKRGEQQIQMKIKMRRLI